MSTYVFLIVGRNSWHDFLSVLALTQAMRGMIVGRSSRHDIRLYLSVLALTAAMRGRLLEIWIIDFALYLSMSELLEVVYSLIEDYMTNLLSDIRRNIFLFTIACKLQCSV